MFVRSRALPIKMKLRALMLLCLMHLGSSQELMHDPCGRIPSLEDTYPTKLSSTITDNQLIFDMDNLQQFGISDCALLNGCHVRLVQNPEFGTELEWDNDMWYVLCTNCDSSNFISNYFVSFNRIDNVTGAYTCRYRHTFKSFPRLSGKPMWARRVLESTPVISIQHDL